MTVSLAIVSLYIQLQCNGLVSNCAGGFVGGDCNYGQTLQHIACRKVAHTGKGKGNGNGAVFIGSLCPGIQIAGCNVGNAHSSIAICRSVGSQAAA